MPDMRYLYDDASAQLHYDIGRTTDRLARLVPHFGLRQHDIVADFGCAAGSLAPWITPWVESYVGVDFSEPMIRLARKWTADAGIINAKFAAARIPDFCSKHPHTFTVGFALDLSEHIADDEWLTDLRAICHSLRHDGRLYVHTPNARFLIEILKAHNVLLRQFPGHIAVRTTEASVRLLELAGFRDISVQYLPHYNVLRHLHLFSRLPLLGRYLQARLLIVARP